MTHNYSSITELSGDPVSQEQLERICNRYIWAGGYCHGKDVVEAACGAGLGLGYLGNVSNSLEAGDICDDILKQAKDHYKDRFNIFNFNAEELPFEDQSKDVIILFEAIYYLPSVDRFVKECKRVLRPNGHVLIATANKDLFDFNPSPQSYHYYGVSEFFEIFNKEGFEVRCFGDTPVAEISWLQKITRPLKSLAVRLNLIPKTSRGKERLKRIVFGKLAPLPAEIDAHTARVKKPVLLGREPDHSHKVIFCEATLIG